MSPKEISKMLNDSGVDIADEFHSTTLKFVYFGIAMFVADYLSHTLFMYTSEIISRVCFIFIPFY